ncbi:G6PDH family F420-dependent oxidoreductase [Amycolatopsis bartoniae]|uniref:LLM class F420-dependent oxidoreductase n=1 Tax=Amycolatopsis bartoniae TaxID=941986 RepID=A0A8H9IUE3_9PSEU|nr:TIGR03557 family F420-dependent LLM class oxidoreductase [Amycolatopsis bartoniae]MBB2934243.1 G6PDH family F420-dependent oxidoreductase [Amycolatopsis bartoniae]TVT08449.1 TIGR03557 family F420-dependent LLM class oxidoreductase [Amycolatopsis bartoniae]GHF48839.1 LLM class F420-dependent oxidoreductase [Amycolatopsis bartoniae]
MRFGYTLMTEQAGPKELVRHAKAAEESGFAFEVSSDHYSPWLDAQGHAPYAWSVLGAVSQVTDRVELLSFVTCPIMRYHPAVVAQKAATVSLLSDNRFILGLGAGENLNEHVVGRGWPPANVRHEMLAEAVEIIGELFDGGYVNFSGQHYRVDSAKLWDLPDRRTPIGIAVSGQQSVSRFAPVADALIATEPKGDLVKAWDAERAKASADATRKFAQLPVSFGTDREAAERRAHEQFRWFSGGWKVNAELPGTSAFAGATQYVRQSDVAESIPCGADVDAIVEAVKPFADAGFTDLAFVQIGGDQQDPFFEFAKSDLLPALEKTYG